MRSAVWGVFLAGFMLSRGVRAQAVPSTPVDDEPTVVAEQHPAPPLESKPKRHWYGLPIVITDAAAYGLLVTAVELDSSYGYALAPSLAGYVLGGPIVHGVHGHWGHAGLSLLMRTALPVGGALIGADCNHDYGYRDGCASDGCGSDQCGKGTVIFAVVGMAVASAIDLGALSWEDVEPAPSLQPVVSARRDGAWIGASGTF